ncbi:hypothetical protein C7H84_25860 [Burkholderia sp. Nafp2/4-1b]|uniref:hypothetical protein n=1 Tax=Burkholderia sp. Nafp2/4-1b TaxID=2116686 RepID=UPI000EF9092C|nr:hypothetical protein [Burkholderia sp. Nafp2/4-1b]RKU00524.1 hypothetical protein C7H84_25860 [Burkholderia sp. Nafp2/4-1b]
MDIDSVMHLYAPSAVICDPDRFAVDRSETMPYAVPRILLRPAHAGAARYPIGLRAGAPARRPLRTDR